jgi:hypothetical protein
LYSVMGAFCCASSSPKAGEFRLRMGDVGTGRQPASHGGLESPHALAQIGRHMISPQLPDSPAGFLESWRGHRRRLGRRV